MRIYLDACCVNRLTDEQSQVRIRQEAEAIERILGIVREGKYSWLSSDVLTEEIENSPQIERRNENRGLLVLPSELILMDHHILDRARQLEAIGYAPLTRCILPVLKPDTPMCYLPRMTDS